MADPKALYRHKAWLTGASAFVIATVVASFINGAPWVIFLVVAVLGLSGAQFSAWRDMRASRDTAAQFLAAAGSVAPPAEVAAGPLEEVGQLSDVPDARLRVAVAACELCDEGRCCRWSVRSGTTTEGVKRPGS
jgi:hypothetical protein